MRTFARFFIGFLTISCVVYGSDQVERKEISPGVVYEEITKKEIPLKIHVISVDLTREDISIAVRAARGLRKLSELADEEEKRGGKVVGGINGDYFAHFGSTPLGIEIVDGILKRPPNIRSAFLVNHRNEVLITATEMTSAIILSNGATFEPAVTNRWAKRGYSGLFSVDVPKNWEPPVDSTCAWLKPTEPIIVNKSFEAKVTKIKSDPAWVDLGDSPILLIEPTKKAELLNGKLAVGDTVKVRLEVRGIKGQIMQAIGGGPRMVRDGKKSVEDVAEQMGGHQVYGDEPRVGIGYTKDGRTVKLFAVDGRVNDSVGTSLDKLADIMIEQGIWQGMAEDGGGSISMITGTKRDDLVTRAQGSGVHDNERRISNALMILQKPANTAKSGPNNSAP